ncbi:Rho GTPase-activating protein 5 [Liparis tanakae]|uniref:Rho GTPase-activating protein 5 n=1 Tax=Liparis tanakae TaxID=230148 RepID=A0A4Z2H3F2_9TELE|nr:Rho GTPase-activating protein 5 [Liparis tanakae]
MEESKKKKRKRRKKERKEKMRKKRKMEENKKESLTTEGLYRVSGNKTDQDNIQKLFDQDHCIDFVAMDLAVNAAAGALKAEEEKRPSVPLSDSAVLWRGEEGSVFYCPPTQKKREQLLLTNPAFAPSSPASPPPPPWRTTTPCQPIGAQLHLPHHIISVSRWDCHNIKSTSLPHSLPPSLLSLHPPTVDSQEKKKKGTRWTENKKRRCEEPLCCCCREANTSLLPVCSQSAPSLLPWAGLEPSRL